MFSRSRLERLKENNWYKEQSTIVYQKILLSGHAISDKELSFVEKIIKGPLFQSDDTLLTCETRYYKYSTLGFYAQAKKDYRLITEYARKTLYLVQNSSGSPYRYITIMKNLCSVLLRLNNFDEVVMRIAELKDFASKLDQSKWKGAYHSAVIIAYQLELALYINSGEFQLIPTIVTEIEEKMRYFSKTIQMTELTDMKYNIAHGLFIIKNYDKSLKCILDILNQPSSKVREDFFASSQIIFFLIHYEMGNKVVLANLLQNAVSQLKKRTNKFDLAKIFLESLQQLSKVDDPAKTKNILESVKFQLNLD